MTARTRPLSADDAPALARLARENRRFLAPWEPLRDERWYTEDGQRDEVGAALGRAELGLTVPRVVVDGAEVVGRITLNNVVRGAFQSCSLGYWLAERATGRGLATEALGEVLGVAFDELGLHRVEAGTLVHNVASQRVLAHHGFIRFGLAPRYLQIAGRWQDHLLFQLLNPAMAD